MAREKLYPKNGLFGTTVYVNKHGEFVGKSIPGTTNNLIRNSKGRVIGKSYGTFGLGFPTDKENK